MLGTELELISAQSAMVVVLVVVVGGGGIGAGL